ncbi:hypothetical protein [Micromonospora avicenniae]|uniref:hypothetical protein n=1 Tax=Micromonospora avicenniae TaxID=1198245 RepID=UPI00331E7379
MTTELWDQEAVEEVKVGIEKLPPSARLEVALSVLEWTVGALPDGSRALLAEEAGKTVDAAISWVRRSLAGEDVSGVPEDLVDELFEWSDELHVVDLWQLFNALIACVGVPAAKTSVPTALNTLSACYDVIRDCEGLEFPLETPEEEVLTAQRANANCMAAISKQKEIVDDAIARNLGR